MAEESSSIALQFAIQMRGLTKVTQLNAALKELKTNVIAVQKGVATGATNLKNLGAGATAAAKGMKDLSKANEQYTRTARNNDRLGKDIAAIQKKQAADVARSQAQIAKIHAKTNDHMAKTFRDAQAKMAREEQRAARESIALQKRKAAEQAAAQKTLTARVTAELRKFEAQAARMEMRRTAILQRESAKRQAIEDRAAQRNSASLRTRLSAWEEHFDAIFRAGFRLQMVGNDLKQLGMAGVNALKGVSEEFANFEFMVNRATGAIGINAGEMDKGVDLNERFADAIQDAAQELRFFKPEEVAKATYYWASTTGQQVDTLEQLESVMRSVNPLMKIAAMTETDYETAIKGVYSILIQYGMGLDEVQQVTEKLHMVTQRTAAEFPDLVNSFKMVGPVAREFGVTFDDMVVLLGRLADAGIRGTMSGRAFRQFFIQISRPSGPAKKALDALWESTQQFGDGRSYLETVFPKGEFIGVNEYVSVLANRMQDLDTKTRMFTLASITTANELPVLTALVSAQIQEIKGLGDGWDYTKENLEDASASFESSWEKLRTSWKGTLGALTRGAEIIRLKVGKQLAEILAPTFEKFVGVLVNVREWFEDANNGPMIQFVTRLVAMGSAALVVAGSIAVFGGALVGLFAVIKVVFGAFAPLLKVFSVAGGVVVALALAVARNFEYIKNTIVEAFEIVKDAMNENKDSLNTLSDAFNQISQVVGIAMDFVVRSIADLIKILAQVIAFVLRFEPAMVALGAAANVLAVIIGAKLALSFVRLGASMLAVPFKAVATGLAHLALASKVSGGGITGLGKGLGMLLPALGPAGWLIAGLTGAAAVMFTLYQSSENFKGSVDRFVFEWITGLDEIIAKAEEAQASLGEFSPNLDVALSGSPEYKAMADEIKRLEELTSGGDWFVDFAERGQLLDLDLARKELAQFESDVVGTMRDAVSQLNREFGANITFDEYISRLNHEADKLGVTITDVAAEGATWDFFRNTTLDAKALNKEASDIMGKMTSLDMKEVNSTELLGSLANAVGSGKLSGAVAEDATRLVNEGLAKGLLDSGVEEEDVAKLWSDTAKAIIDGAKGMKDFDKNLAAVLKENLGPGSAINSVFKSTETGLIQAGFLEFTPSQRAMAIAESNKAWSDVRTIMQQELDLMAATGIDASPFVGSVVNNFESDLESKFNINVPQSVIEEMGRTAVFIYGAMGVPVPQHVIDLFATRGVTLSEGTAEGVRNGLPAVIDAGEEVPKNVAKGMNAEARRVSTAALNIADKAKSGVNFYTSSNYLAWASSLGQNFARGLTAQGTLVYNSAMGLAKKAAGPLKHSTPVVGPLKDDDMWGVHFVENFAGGIKQGLPKVERSVSDMANAIARARDIAIGPNMDSQGIGFETTSNRTIKVQIEVTSPDGSVDRVKAADFERALISGDLLMSIEHMATVG